MRVKFWGLRGSIATCSSDTARYGGNTACFEVQLDDGTSIILDAGTGIRTLGMEMRERHPTGGHCAICISHGHWDHILGLPFFEPVYDPRWRITLYGPAHIDELSLEGLLERIFNPINFPVPWARVRDRIALIPLTAGKAVTLGTARLLPVTARHSGGALAFRIDADGSSLFYSGDYELGPEPPNMDTDFFRTLRNADVAIMDGHYTQKDYLHKVGWGHSAMEQWLPLAETLGIGRMALVHYDPLYSDAMLDNMAQTLSAYTPQRPPRVHLVHEGTVWHTGADAHSNPLTNPQNICRNCTFSSELFSFTDISMVFESLLSETRRQTCADAGTIYLLEGDTLVFAYTHNDSLFSASDTARMQYIKGTLPVNTHSIAGFVADKKEILHIDDVYTLPADAPYTFNSSFDQATGYRTQSVCALPLCTLDGKLVGVLQLINSIPDGKGGAVRPFTPHMQRQAENLCRIGSQAIERAHMMRDTVLRMLEAAALRDPSETAGHVMRVGSLAAELYHAWAIQKNVPHQEMMRFKDQLRMAAMLHDVGKVGISDRILKKPGRLTPEEREVIETHCALGAGLFADAQWDMDAMAEKIALHHHQKWDGTGYGGQAEGLLAGEGIPFEARLTAIADVFDALVSPRCYKEPWPVEKAVALLQSEAGRHFDPDMVQAFVEIQDTMLAIHAKYPLTGG